MSENQNETPTMEEAIEETRELIGAMADSIRNVKGSQASINAQDIPNEIRGILNQSPVVKTYYDVQSYLTDISILLKQGGSTIINAQDFPDVIQNLDVRYLAPNGQKYYYKTTLNISSGGGIYNFYTDKPLFVCEDRKNSSNNYYLLSYLKDISNLDTIASLSTYMGRYDINASRIYPSGSGAAYSKTPAASYGQNEATCPYNWGINITPQEVTNYNITKYNTVEEAYQHITT